MVDLQSCTAEARADEPQHVTEIDPPQPAPRTEPAPGEWEWSVPGEARARSASPELRPPEGAEALDADVERVLDSRAATRSPPLAPPITGHPLGPSAADVGEMGHGLAAAGSPVPWQGDDADGEPLPDAVGALTACKMSESPARGMHSGSGTAESSSGVEHGVAGTLPGAAGLELPAGVHDDVAPEVEGGTAEGVGGAPAPNSSSARPVPPLADVTSRDESAMASHGNEKGGVHLEGLSEWVCSGEKTTPLTREDPAIGEDASPVEAATVGCAEAADGHAACHAYAGGMGSGSRTMRLAPVDAVRDGAAEPHVSWHLADVGDGAEEGGRNTGSQRGERGTGSTGGLLHAESCGTQVGRPVSSLFRVWCDV